MTEWVPAKDDSPDRVDALVHGITALAGIQAHMEIAIPSGNFGGGMGVPAGTSLGPAFGYRPQQFGMNVSRETVETPEETVRRMQHIADTTSPELFLPRRIPCRDGEHPGAFESQATEGQLVCSRCLHHVEHEEGVLVRKTGASQMSMTS